MSFSFPRRPSSINWLAWIWRVPLEIWLFLALWFLYGILINSSNLTEFNLQQIGVEAIVERGQFFVEGSPTPQLQPQGDVFEYNGHLYAAKQPGQFLFGASIYFFLHWFGLRYLDNFLLSSALVTWFTAGLVTASAAIAIYRLAYKLALPNGSRGWAIGVALAFALATTAFPYAGIAHHDAIASGLLLVAFYFVFRLAHEKKLTRPHRYAALAGVLLGFTITTSMLPFFMVLIVSSYFLSLRQWRNVPFFVLGGLVGLAPLFVYDTLNFGNPFTLPNLAGNYSDTFFHLDAENFLAKIQFYGILLTLYAPIVWFGVVGWFFVPRQFRREEFVVFALILVLCAYIFNIDATGDCQFGPRYLLPAMPFAALGLIGFRHIVSRRTQRVVVLSALAVALFSFVVNFTGASFGAMFCDLRLYAFTEYLNAALGARFWSYPLAAWLALPFLFSLAALYIFLLTRPTSRQADTAAQSLFAKRWKTFQARWKIFVNAQSLLLLTLVVAAFFRFYRLWGLPPGLALDEAFYALDAQRVLEHGTIATFFPQNGGREALFIYLQAMALALWGVHPWVLRIVPVLVGIITIPLVYQLGRVLFAKEARGKYVGMIAAAALAVSYWHVTFSRLGLRAILLPAVSALAMYFFWRGWQTGRRRDLIFSGIALGITFYTYSSARLLPFVLIGFVATILVLAWVEQKRRTAHQIQSPDGRRTLSKLGIVLGVALVVALPLSAYFFVYPNDFVGRAQAVVISYENVGVSDESAGARPFQVIIENTVRVAGMFFVRGDFNPRHNLPGRPALDVLTAFGFLIGVITGTLRARQQPQSILLFIWLLLMLAPSVFSADAPHFLRAIGALPPLLILSADGLTRVWQKFLPNVSLTFCVLLVLLFGSALTFRDYFQTWTKLPTVYQEAFDTSSAFLGARILQESENADVLVPLRVFGRPALQFALAPHFKHAQPFSTDTSLDKPLVIVTAQGSEDRQWVLLRRDVLGEGQIFFPKVISGLAQLRVSEPQPIQGANGARAGQVIPLRKRARTLLLPPTPTHLTDANFAGQLRLMGYDANPSRVQPDETVEVALYWQALQDLERDYLIQLEIVDDAGQVQAEWKSEPVFGFYTSGLWRRGAIVTDLYPLHIPADTKPGEYQLQASWLSGPARLNLLDAQGQETSDAFVFGKIVVAAK